MVGEGERGNHLRPCHRKPTLALASESVPTRPGGPQTYLLAHGLGVGDGCAEEAIPLETPVEAGPVVVPVPSVGKAPGDKGVELSGRRLTGLACRERGL